MKHIIAFWLLGTWAAILFALYLHAPRIIFEVACCIPPLVLVALASWHLAGWLLWSRRP